jgi:chromosome partitioning protein
MATRTIAIANEKGGVGKTVTVVNLAAALTRLNQNVLVIDMDPQANATKGLGIDPDRIELSVYDLLSNPNGTQMSKAVSGTAWEGLDVIASNVDLAGAEVELVDVAGREDRLNAAMADLDDAYDVILIDTPPSLSLLTVNVFAYAKQVLIPCQTHPYSFAALSELFDTVNAVKAEINPQIEILGILPTFFDARTRVSRQVLDQLRTDERYRDRLFQTVVRINTTIAESAAVGKPVVFYRQGSYGAIDYNDLADEVLDKG